MNFTLRPSEGTKLYHMENEDTFTIDSKINFKMNTDFLNSVRKSNEPTIKSMSIPNNKENNNSVNVSGNKKKEMT